MLSILHIFNVTKNIFFDFAKIKKKKKFFFDLFNADFNSKKSINS